VDYTFRHDALKKLLKLAEGQWAKGPTQPLYDDQDSKAPGFWVVGDDGIYIMHNGQSHPVEEGETQPVVYADECNPKTMPFEIWWENKRDGWGGDDGAEYLDKSIIEHAVRHRYDLVLRFEVDQMFVNPPK
jgi:Protein of unknown function (DUF3085)